MQFAPDEEAFPLGQRPRSGNITFPGSALHSIPTPAYAVFTEACQVPYITVDHLQHLFERFPFFIELPFFSAYSCVSGDVLDSFADLRPDATLSDFLSYRSFPTLCTIRAGSRTLSRTQVLLGVTRSGTSRLTKEQFEHSAAKSGFSACVSPWSVVCDNLPVAADGRPQQRRGFDHEAILSTSFGLFHPLTSTPIGVRLGDIFEPSVPRQELCVQRVRDSSSAPGVRLSCSSGHPLEVLDWAAAGVDLFAGDYPFRIARLGFACCFPVTVSEEEEEEGEGGNKSVASTFWKLDLNDERLRTDFTPFVHGCECEACRNHTRAYVHHLLNCHEMTGYILLSIHNLFHYLGFVNSMRESIQEGSFDQFREFYVQKSKS